MKGLLTTICVLSLILLVASPRIESEIPYQEKGFLLDSIFPIDNILSITVTNYSGRHVLNAIELEALKEQLKNAKFAGGLLIKPGHITLSIKLKDNSNAKSGFVYASIGSIHFDGGVDRFEKHFTGTFHLPTKLNFDNYK